MSFHFDFKSRWDISLPALMFVFYQARIPTCNYENVTYRRAPGILQNKTDKAPTLCMGRFSSPGRSPGRAIVLPPASASALASASAVASALAKS